MDGFSLFLTILTAFGGLALFIYGMNLMGEGLEKASGSKLEKVLDKMTKNAFVGVLLGAAVTAIIQSSSGTTVIVVGLVNAGMLKLRSAIGVIMGANIGTTVTGQILRLAELDSTGSASNAMKLLQLSSLIPIICLVGLIIVMLSKKSTGKNIGQIFLGLGILFTGMNAMTAAVKPLAELPAFGEAFAAMQNPILGVLVGAGVTAIIQSSSASVGILQAMSTSGLITFSAAFPIIMGQNIGTTVTSILSAIGTTTNAKRAAAVHLLFNIIGTVIFLSAIYIVQNIVHFPFWDDPIDMGGIANFHTLFNVTCTLLFLPFIKAFEKLATLIIRDKKSKTPVEQFTLTLDERLLKSPSLAIGQAMHTLLSMANLSKYNFDAAKDLLITYVEEQAAEIRQNNDSVDRMEDGLNSYLVKIAECELTEFENRRVTMLMYLTTEYSRIGAYAMNILENAETLHADGLSFSPKARAEMDVIFAAVDDIILTALKATERSDTNLAYRIEPLEETVDALNDTLKSRHIDRLKNGECAVESGVVFLDMLVNLERIADHCSNIAVYVIGSSRGHENISRHEYIENLHNKTPLEYKTLLEDFEKKYALE
ncbi:MAG: Na/Pi cotransporter family protein [Ruminococcus sp.]|jgi:phosphate:Na+ symporter|nr:Na/Pi cotransporter family protein [Ruminococcus sp.]